VAPAHDLVAQKNKCSVTIEKISSSVGREWCLQRQDSGLDSWDHPNIKCRHAMTTSLWIKASAKWYIITIVYKVIHCALLKSVIDYRYGI
jgi:hypothetical protein